MAAERGYRVYQLRKPKNRHLADVRQVDELPAHRAFEHVQVIDPIELIAMKLTSYAARRDRPKGDTDRADLRRLLLAFPALKREHGPVEERLRSAGAPQEAMAAWSALATETLLPDEDEDD